MQLKVACLFVPGSSRKRVPADKKKQHLQVGQVVVVIILQVQAHLELHLVSDNTVENQVRKAEIMWTLYTVCNNYSFSSNRDLGYVLKEMFTDSTIASKFELAETKTKYVREHGIPGCPE